MKLKKIEKVFMYVVASGSLAHVVETLLGGMVEAGVQNYTLMGILNILFYVLVAGKKAFKESD